MKIQDIVDELAKGGATLEQAERGFRESYILAVLRICGNNRCQAARILDIHRNTISRVMGRKHERMHS